MPPKPGLPRFRRVFGLRRLAAWVVASATDVRASRALVAAVIILHVGIWSRALTLLKQGQDIHFDVAEAFAWGQQFLLGYGKHPPLSGWVAGLWFRIFPAADWAAYALAMMVAGIGLWLCWLIALKVVDRRRALLSVLLLAIYPIFNFKGYKYNADLIQLITLPLLVLAYLHAFERRTLRAGVWLGLAGALAMLAKYWALTMIGAIGLAALLHPQRLQFLRSPAPWAAIVVMFIGLAPHLWWLWQVGFTPLSYAGGIYEIPSRLEGLRMALGYLEHNVALLLLPIVLGLLTLISLPVVSPLRSRDPFRTITQGPPRSAYPAARWAQALQIWMIQLIVAIGPPLGGIAFSIYMKTDWGIPLFFLTPLALLAIPGLRVPRIALFRVMVIWLLASLAVLAAAPQIAEYVAPRNRSGIESYGARSELARNLTEEWHVRFKSQWRAVIGPTRITNLMAFYSVDHPTPLPLNDPSSGLISLAEAQRSGYVGICDPAAPDYRDCDAWMKANAPLAERVIVTTRRFFQGKAGEAAHWDIYYMPPLR